MSSTLMKGALITHPNFTVKVIHNGINAISSDRSRKATVTLVVEVWRIFSNNACKVFYSHTLYHFQGLTAGEAGGK